MDKIIIVGGSAGARIASEIFKLKGKQVMYACSYFSAPKEKYLGDNLEDVLPHLKKYDYFIATGDNAERMRIWQYLIKTIWKPPVNAIHPSVTMSFSSKHGTGILMAPRAVVHTGAYVSDGCIVNTSSVVEHDCFLGPFSQLSPSATLCGYVDVGTGAFIGAGSVVIPKIKVGGWSIIGAGASVINDVSPCTTVVGVPAVEKVNK